MRSSTFRPDPSSNSPVSFALYFGVAALAASLDWLTKFAAVRTLDVGELWQMAGRFGLMLTYNTGSAGSVSVGPYTWHLNVLVTGAALAMITMIVRQLSQVDPRASIALGLVAGGAMGNMASMLFGPPGVTDFFAIQLTPSSTMVMNFADAALWTGALSLLPVVKSLVVAIRAERRGASARLAKA